MAKPNKNEIYAAERLALVLKGTGLGLWDWNPQTGAVVFDERWCQMLGYELSEIEPTLDSWSSRVHPDDLDACYADIQAHIDGKTPYYANQYRMRHKDGHWIHILDRGQVMERDQNGAPIRFTGSHDDVSWSVSEKQKVTEQASQLRSAYEKLNALRDKQTHMYAVIAHELRTPAAIIKMLLESHEQGDELEFEVFESNVDHLLSVLDTLGAVAQPEQLAEAKTEDICVRDLITQLSLSFAVQARRANVRIVTELDGLTGEMVRMPRTLIRQVLSNLIKNALIHSGCSCLTIHAQGSIRSDGLKNLRVCVRDDGRGIALDEASQLFEPYARGRTEADGSGLGLYVCREIIRSLDGELWFEIDSNMYGQFVFELQLPLSEEEQISVVASNIEQLEGKHILLAEDDKMLQLLTQKLLSGKGARVTVADNGADALKFADQLGQIDLVLTDIFMPKMNGYELVQELRKQGSDLLIVGLTAATVGKESDQIIEAGADAVLYKPLDIRQLAALIAA